MGTRLYASGWQRDSPEPDQPLQSGGDRWRSRPGRDAPGGDDADTEDPARRPVEDDFAGNHEHGARGRATGTSRHRAPASRATSRSPPEHWPARPTWARCWRGLGQADTGDPRAPPARGRREAARLPRRPHAAAGGLARPGARFRPRRPASSRRQHSRRADPLGELGSSPRRCPLDGRGEGVRPLRQRRRAHGPLHSRRLLGVFHLVTVGTWVLLFVTRLRGFAQPELVATGGLLGARHHADRCSPRLPRSGVVPQATARISRTSSSRAAPARSGSSSPGSCCSTHPSTALTSSASSMASPMSPRADLMSLRMLGRPEDLPVLVRLFDVERVIFAFSNESRSMIDARARAGDQATRRPGRHRAAPGSSRSSVPTRPSTRSRGCRSWGRPPIGPSALSLGPQAPHRPHRRCLAGS